MQYLRLIPKFILITCISAWLASCGGGDESSGAVPPQQPTAPTGLGATATSSSSISLNWTDNSSNETNFVVQRSTTSGSGFAIIATLGVNVTSYADTTSLSASSTYYYQVYATNGTGGSDYSNEAFATTNPSPTTPPAVPTGLSATTTSPTSISLGWTDNSNDETSFVVQRSTISSSGFITIATLGADTTSYADTSGLSRPNTYYYRVYASNSEDYSGFSNEASAAIQFPIAPTGLVATAASSSSISLSWTDNSIDETNFVVRRSTTSGLSFSTIATLGENTTSYVDTSGLSASTTYYYEVYAISVVGGSDYSNEAFATTALNTFTNSVGGIISGLSGTLQINNNDGNPLSISVNGSYVFPTYLNNSELYNVQINQNPTGQICSIINATGQINNANITNADILCTANTITVSLSGSYQAVPLIYVDSDINDPGATVDINNGSFGTAQTVPNFATIHGFSTKSGTGRIAEGDRFASSEDEFDVYRAVLQKDQTLRLQVVDFSGSGIFTGDLDLELYDTAFNLVGFSNSETEFENVVVPATGDYYISIYASSGSSKYTLSLDGVSALVFQVPNSIDFRLGEAVIKFKSSLSVNSFTSSNPSMSLSHYDDSRAVRGNFDLDTNKVSALGSFQPLDFEQSLEQRNLNSHRKFKTIQKIKQLNQRLDIEYAEPNYIYYPQLVPNDQFYSLQWHYPSINLPQAWDITTGSTAGNDVIVAVVDTGAFLTHPEFAGQLVSGYDFISSTSMSNDGDGIDANPDDPGDNGQVGSSSWHGTHVAGTVAALSNNNSGVAGIAWGAKIMPVRTLGIGGGTNYDIIQSIRFAAGLSNDSNTVPAQRADIINLSLGGPGYSQASQDAYNAVSAAGVIVVAAAGNDNNNQLFYPASYDNVISVSATDFANNRAPYSNFGARIDIAAPGGNTGVDLNNDGYGDGVLSTLVDDSSGTRNPTFAFYQGTSMASPHVAGVFALMRAVHPTLSPDDIDSLLSAGSITTDIGSVGRDDLYGHGLIDALKAVQAAQSLANGGTLPPQPALIVASPSQLTMGLSGSSILTLSNQGGTATSVTSFSSSASWLSISPSSIDSNGMGDYQVLIDRTGLVVGSYSGTITFILATGNSLDIQVSILVGAQDTTSNMGKIYTLLINNSGNTVAQVLAIDQGNGVFDYTFTNVASGFYRVIAGSDVDNDLFICQLGESCGGYSTLSPLSVIEAINRDIAELDFTVGILANFGTSSLSLGANPTVEGFQRQPMKSMQLDR